MAKSGRCRTPSGSVPLTADSRWSGRRRNCRGHLRSRERRPVHRLRQSPARRSVPDCRHHRGCGGSGDPDYDAGDCGGRLPLPSRAPGSLDPGCRAADFRESDLGRDLCDPVGRLADSREPRPFARHHQRAPQGLPAYQMFGRRPAVNRHGLVAWRSPRALDRRRRSLLALAAGRVSDYWAGRLRPVQVVRDARASLPPPARRLPGAGLVAAHLAHWRRLGRRGRPGCCGGHCLARSEPQER